MNQKIYFVVCGSVFFVVAAAHLTRLVGGWEIAIAGWTAPYWLSVLGLIVPGLLSIWGFALASRSGSTGD